MDEGDKLIKFKVLSFTILRNVPIRICESNFLLIPGQRIEVVPLMVILKYQG